MNTETAVNHLTRLKRNLRDIYSSARIFQSSVDDLLKSRLSVYEDPGYKRLPRWARSELQGVSDQLFEDIQRNWVVWGCWHKGKFYSNWESYPEEVKEQCRSNEYPQKHYWLREQFKRGKTLQVSGIKAIREYIVTDKVF